MAITKIHPIKSTLKKALDYIENPAKTDEKMLVSSFACSYETADIEFELLLSQAMQKGNNLAHHLIQSFAPGETTPEQAHEIGRQLADEVLQGKYPYVLTTHIDKGHVHNHIIFCAVDMVNQRKYVSNRQSYAYIRRTSDRLCKEHGLSVVMPGQDRGKSYAEWDAHRKGTSWKIDLDNESEEPSMAEVNDNGSIQLFEDQKIRTAWDAEKEEWYFSIIDVISVLTGTANPRRYWSDLKRKLKAEGANELYEKIVQLKMLSSDGKRYKTDVTNTEQLLRIIQSIPSPKAEPFKAWLAMVGKERIEETIDPEQAIDRALDTYLKKGYSEEWIHQRLLAIRIRNELTDEWKKRGVQKGKEYAILTDEISRAWSGMTTGQYKRLKGLTKENLRDNMTDLELVLTMLAEASTTDISKTAKPQTFEENKQVAKRGGKVAGIARQALEAETGKPVITEKNAFDFQQLVTDIVEDAAELPENPTEKKDKD